MEQALLVTVALKHENRFNLKLAKQELCQLAATARAAVCAEITCQRGRIDPAYFIGSGKTAQLLDLVEEKGVDIIIFNNDLSSSQQRNLEKALNVKIIDRTQLILDIFAQHAHSQEGKLQVELAQLEYFLPRLSGKGIMLSRLGGGIGTRGPGEKKLEVDRRRIRGRIGKLKVDLENLKNHRQTLRKRRINEAIPVIAFVGYTNAGKSTLINKFTGAGQIVKDSLFTTLDPLNRAKKLKNKHKVIFSDTVGFLDRLPHGLVEAFKATLEEVRCAQLLVHVLDISFPQYEQRARAVDDVLKELNAHEKPLITALNKIDQLEDRGWLGRIEKDFPNAVAISAQSGEGLERLEDLIISQLQLEFKNVVLSLPLDKIQLVDLIYRQGNVKCINYTNKAIELEADLPLKLVESLKAYQKNKP